jgi:RNA polymerase sigma-70 factor (ECF subfamily)
MAESPAEQRTTVDRYVAAFERADLSALAELLADDVVLEMPPMWNWYLGVDDYLGFMRRVFRLRGTDWRMEPLWANGEAALAAYAAGQLHTVQVVTVSHGLVTRLTAYQDPAVFDLFHLRDEPAGPHR